MAGHDADPHGDAGLDHPGPVGDRGAVEEQISPVFGANGPEPRVLVEGDNDSVQLWPGQWTILASGTSMMSVAPWSFRAGIKVLICALGATVSTA